MKPTQTYTCPPRCHRVRIWFQKMRRQRGPQRMMRNARMLAEALADYVESKPITTEQR